MIALSLAKLERRGCCWAVVVVVVATGLGAAQVCIQQYRFRPRPPAPPATLGGPPGTPQAPVGPSVVFLLSGPMEAGWCWSGRESSVLKAIFDNVGPHFWAGF